MTGGEDNICVADSTGDDEGSDGGGEILKAKSQVISLPSFFFFWILGR